MSYPSLVLTVCAMVLGSVPPAGAAAEPAPPPVRAIWKSQEINFYFHSLTTAYSCTGLEDKLGRILRRLGVRAEVKVRSTDCPSSVARLPRVMLSVTSAVEATPEAFAERDKNKSTRELSARMRGQVAEEAEALAEFPAQWRRVALSRRALGLGPGDCDLIDELRRKVLPKLAVRIVKDEVLCSPTQLSLRQPRMEVEVLVALPRPDQVQQAQ